MNDIFGLTKMEWSKTVWESDLEAGLHLLRTAVDTHEVNDGTNAYNATHYRVSFFYDLYKASVGRMAAALAHELRPHGATALSLTPGWLRSEAMLDAYGVSESAWQDAAKRQPHFAIAESPAFVGRAVAALAQDPDVARWNGRSVSSGELAKIYGFTDTDGSRPDAWRYVVEVQDAGKPADVTGYRYDTSAYHPSASGVAPPVPALTRIFLARTSTEAPASSRIVRALPSTSTIRLSAA